MDIVEDVRRHGGVERVAALRARGHGRRGIEGAVSRGILTRPRQGWVADPRADPMLVAAARGGVVLSCVTQAARSGLWVPDARVTHVAAPPNSNSVTVDRTRTRVHHARPLTPRPPGLLEDPIENVLALVADCLPQEHALAVWESAFRQDRADRLVMLGKPLKTAARRIAEIATPFADSGVETIVAHRLRWLDVAITPQVQIAGRPVDILIGDRLVIQIDGSHHVDRQRDADIEHDARLRLMGFHVIRISYRHVMHEWPRTQQRILDAIASGLHLERAVA